MNSYKTCTLYSSKDQSAATKTFHVVGQLVFMMKTKEKHTNGDFLARVVKAMIYSWV